MRFSVKVSVRSAGILAITLIKTGSPKNGEPVFYILPFSCGTFNYFIVDPCGPRIHDGIKYCECESRCRGAADEQRHVCKADYGDHARYILKENARCTNDVTSGRKNTIRTCALIERFTSLRLIPTFCIISKRFLSHSLRISAYSR